MSGSAFAQLLPLLLITAVFFFLVIRPARARQREALELQRSLRTGQQVLTTAGLYATVVALEDDVVVLETAPGVTSRWARAAVARVLTPPATGIADDAGDGQQAGATVLDPPADGPRTDLRKG